MVLTAILETCPPASAATAETNGHIERVSGQA
jgi:hypothetical protein